MAAGIVGDGIVEVSTNLTREVVEEVAHGVVRGTESVFEGISALMLVLQALGIVALLGIIFWVISFVLARRRNKKMEEINERLERIERKIESLRRK